jgi:hypothetical protein
MNHWQKNLQVVVSFLPAASSFVRPSPIDRGRVAGARGAAGDADGKRALVCTAGAVGGVAALVGAGVTGMMVVVE